MISTQVRVLQISWLCLL